MIVLQLEGGSTGDIEAAKREIAVLTGRWGYEITDGAAAMRERVGSESREERVIHPVSVTALIVSLPRATLAVLDQTDLGRVPGGGVSPGSFRRA